MRPKPDDLCPRPEALRPGTTQPVAPSIHLSSVYQCTSTEEADLLLDGRAAGYVYARDGHPNADLLGEKCRALHAAPRAALCGTGMAAMGLAAIACMQSGDHVVVSNQLYGRSLALFTKELARLGISSTVVDTSRPDEVSAACHGHTRMIVVETIGNPLLTVPDLAALAAIARRFEAALLVDNTFATPVICRPLELGADFVVESLTKMMNGHSDVTLGLLCGRDEAWSRVPYVLSTWGWTAPAFECWLAQRGLGTLAVRMERAGSNALALARHLQTRPAVAGVVYPGLADHPDHAVAARQFGNRFGNMVTFHLHGGRPAVNRFIAAARHVAFAPSLGDLSTTLSHPESTSHRGLTPEARAALGITPGTLRISVGIESPEAVLAAFDEGLAAVTPR